MQLSHKYKVECMELKAKISDLRQKLSAIGKLQYRRHIYCGKPKIYRFVSYVEIPEVHRVLKDNYIADTMAGRCS